MIEVKILMVLVASSLSFGQPSARYSLLIYHDDEAFNLTISPSDLVSVATPTGSDDHLVVSPQILPRYMLRAITKRIQSAKRTHDYQRMKHLEQMLQQWKWIAHPSKKVPKTGSKRILTNPWLKQSSMITGAFISTYAFICFLFFHACWR